jgi:hypothetical protein
MTSKAHLTEEGIEEISKIKSSMNSSRVFTAGFAEDEEESN